MSATVYAVAAHRSFDNYYSKFLGFGTLAEAQAAFRRVATELAELAHGSTLTFRRDTRCVSHQNDGIRRPRVDHRTPDEFVVLRYDVPADADTLHIQTVRWKYGGLTLTGRHEAPPEWPEGIDLLNDCVNEYVWTRPAATVTTNTTTTPPASAVVTV